MHGRGRTPSGVSVSSRESLLLALCVVHQPPATWQCVTVCSVLNNYKISAEARTCAATHDHLKMKLASHGSDTGRRALGEYLRNSSRPDVARRGVVPVSGRVHAVSCGSVHVLAAQELVHANSTTRGPRPTQARSQYTVQGILTVLLTCIAGGTAKANEARGQVRALLDLALDLARPRACARRGCRPGRPGPPAYAKVLRPCFTRISPSSRPELRRRLQPCYSPATALLRLRRRLAPRAWARLGCDLWLGLGLGLGPGLRLGLGSVRVRARVRVRGWDRVRVGVSDLWSPRLAGCGTPGGR